MESVVYMDTVYDAVVLPAPFGPLIIYRCLSAIIWSKGKEIIYKQREYGLYFYIFYRNDWIWKIPPVGMMRNWEVQSAIAVVSRPQKANNNIIRFIFTFLFRGL